MSKILFLLEDYNLFYTNGTNEIQSKSISTSYNKLITDLISKKYYQSDSMAAAFNRIGHDTRIIIPEANPLQLQWAKENNKKLYYRWLAERPVRSFKSRILKQHRNSYNSIQFRVLLDQIKQYKPEIIYIYSNIYLTENQIRTLKKNCSKIILQWAAPLFHEKLKFPYHAFDLIVTAAIQLKEYFESKNYNVTYLQQAFDDGIIDQVDTSEINKTKDLVFIGSFTPAHKYRFEVIEYLLQKGINIAIYGLGRDSIPKDSLVYKTMKEPLYGIDMYNEYKKYKMALHVHITGRGDDAINWDKYAGAKRLFEITGIGTLLLTPEQDNIKDLFDVENEIITFKSKEELIEKIRFYLSNPTIIEKISQKGMKRTLEEHSFSARAKQLSKEIFK